MSPKKEAFLYKPIKIFLSDRCRLRLSFQLFFFFFESREKIGNGSLLTLASRHSRIQIERQLLFPKKLCPGRRRNLLARSRPLSLVRRK